ncbi:MAG: DUF3604 domain-containing protein, partial [Gemmatimonadota bacterium]|nr:DUF3604 domain-containing protein [Gemmatimonadota bacterium]
MSLSMDRRKWMKKCSAWLASTGLLAGSSVSCKGTENGSSAGSSGPGYNAYFGDIHNHNSLGYAKGSLERSFDIAASHLDFFSMTPHSHWHDMPVMEKNKHMIWVNGFKKTREGWPKARKLTESYYKPGRFVTFHGYEWHSSRYGDFCMIFPGNDAPMTAFDSPEQLQEFAFGKGALLIPHHPAYLQGRRGANPSVWDPRVTGLLEIFSEHGNAEIDRGPCDYIRHSMGGRSTPNTLQ